MLHPIAQGTFADVIKGMDFITVRLFWIIQVGPISSHELLNVEEGGRSVSQRWEHEKDLLANCWFRNVKDCRQGPERGL